ncbi:MAG: DUF58 domain-containing protein [Planctomycetes bacterium]|nr:DUF58 domain-containing protein [Planctomycetota bacterium]
MPDLSDILRQVRRIELRTERLVSSLAAGRYRSAFRGQGMEFDEVREYAAGDDVRAIDWNVTARAGRPYVKVFREERELTVLLLVDVSGSMRFGAIPGISPRAKLALAAEAAAVVGVTALRNGDRLGLVLFSDRTEVHVPARRGRGHALRVVREVLAPAGGARATDLAHALDELARVARRRAVVFLVSDFLHDPAQRPRLATALARAGRRHDVVGLRVSDPGEASLPAVGGAIALDDPEGGGGLVLAGGRAAAARYAAAWGEARSASERQFRAAGCDLVDLSTRESALGAMERFFRQRRRRVHG